MKIQDDLSILLKVLRELMVQSKKTGGVPGPEAPVCALKMGDSPLVLFRFRFIYFVLYG